MAGDGKKVDPTWRMQTKMVRGGLDRSAHRETAEAISMTSGFVYDNAEDAEAAFKGEVECVKVLVEAGANKEAKNNVSPPPTPPSPRPSPPRARA